MDTVRSPVDARALEIDLHQAEAASSSNKNRKEEAPVSSVTVKVGGLWATARGHCGPTDVTAGHWPSGGEGLAIVSLAVWQPGLPSTGSPRAFHLSLHRLPARLL